MAKEARQRYGQNFFSWIYKPSNTLLVYLLTLFLMV